MVLSNWKWKKAVLLGLLGVEQEILGIETSSVGVSKSDFILIKHHKHTE